MRRFDEYLAAASASIDAVMGERLRVEPKALSGTWRGTVAADPDRVPAEFVGRYRARPVTAELEGNREGSKFQSMTRMAAVTHVVRVSPEQLAAIGYVPGAGDAIVFLDRPDAPSFDIVEGGPGGLRDTGEARLVLVSGPATPVAP